MVRRNEDMSPDGSLELIREDDGDIIVRVREAGERGFGHWVQFCTHAGGGASPHTWRALGALMEAMEQDNREKPQGLAPRFITPCGVCRGATRIVHAGELWWVECRHQACDHAQMKPASTEDEAIDRWNTYWTGHYQQWADGAEENE